MDSIIFFILSVLVVSSEMKSVLNNIKKNNQPNGQVQNEVYGTDMNGYNQTPGRSQQQQDKKMYSLPRSFREINKILIKGTIDEGNKMLCLGLTSGIYEPGKENMAFYMKIDKDADKIYFGHKESGYEMLNEGPVSFSDVANDTELNISLKVRKNSQGENILLEVIYIHAIIGKCEFNENIAESTYLFIDGDEKVNELQFSFE